MPEFELKLANGKVVVWEGRDGEDAARRYVDCHRDQSVVATRSPRFGLVIGFDPNRLIEPGHPDWAKKRRPEGDSKSQRRNRRTPTEGTAQ